MGIIKAVVSAIGGGLADSWLEVLEADGMSDQTVMVRGQAVRKNDRRSTNRRGSADYVSDGSIIHVGENQCMLLIDGGKVVDYTAEAGYYKVDNGSAPSMFNGQFGDALKESFSRIKYGGVPSKSQYVLFLNLQEIKGIRFGTRTPVNYFDTFYNAELFLRAHGTYSIKITDPLKFYAEAIPKDRDAVNINDINEQYLNEFLEALQTSVNQMSADGIRISFVASKSMELSKYMANVLDEEWKAMRGMEVVKVGIASVSYTEDSQKLLNMRNEGAMLGDPGVREGYVQGAIARGLESAGSNANGAAAAFMGMGVGMQGAGSFFGAASQSNQAQMQANAAKTPANAWTCACGAQNTGKFCAQCGAKRPDGGDQWKCPACGKMNSGKFCGECGQKKPESAAEWFCAECGHKNAADVKFCSECGKKKP